MGPSGCGKTTLLNCLSGLDDIDDGQVFVEGVELSTLSDNAKTDYRARRLGHRGFPGQSLIEIIADVSK